MFIKADRNIAVGRGDKTTLVEHSAVLDNRFPLLRLARHDM
jgi:hypothetical protein